MGVDWAARVDVNPYAARTYVDGLFIGEQKHHHVQNYKYKQLRHVATFHARCKKVHRQNVQR